MTRKVFTYLLAGFIAATIPGMALANPGNPNGSKERIQGPAPFSVETARALGESSSGGKADIGSAGEPIGAGAVPSGGNKGNQGCETTPAR